MKRRAVIAFAIIAFVVTGLLLWRGATKPNAPDPLFDGKPASVWVELLVRRENNNARHAVQQLGDGAVPWLLPRLSGKDSFFNDLNLKLWPRLAPHLPASLRARWQRPILNKEARMSALEALRDMEPTPSEALVPLMERLRDTDATIRLHSAIALGHIGPAARPAVPLLKPFLKSNHVHRVYTAQALWKINHDADEVLPVLEQGVQEQAPFRWSAAVFLGEMGPAAQHAIPMLEKTTAATDKEAASCALQALAQISPATSVPLLIRTLQDPDPAMRISAAVALGKIAPHARDAVPALIALLDDQATGRPVIMGYSGGPEPVSKAAAQALLRIDPAAAKAAAR